MSVSNGHGGPDADVAVTAARPVALVRYRPGVVGETARTVHVVPLTTNGQLGTVTALCGARLVLTDVENVTVGDGMPCVGCVVMAAAGKPPADGPGRSDTVELCYRQWGWPVSRHRDQVRLSLCREVSARTIPLLLGIEITEILTAQGCVPAVLAHPYAPEHRIVLTGERYGVTLPWPRQVHQVTGFLLIPPTVTARGPITWTQPPQPDSLRRCREIDVFGALRTALRDR